MRYLAITVAAVCASNPCEQLCQLDGPEVCTGGSWPRTGRCHAYFLRPSGEHCYHNTFTSVTCPDSLPASPVESAAILVAALTPATTARPSETTSVTTEPSRERRRRVIPGNLVLTTAAPATTASPSTIGTTEATSSSPEATERRRRVIPGNTVLTTAAPATTASPSTIGTTEATSSSPESTERRRRVVPVVTTVTPVTTEAPPSTTAPARRRRCFPAGVESAVLPVAEAAVVVAATTPAPPRRRCFPSGSTVPVSSSVVAPAIPRAIVPSPIVVAPRAPPRSIPDFIQAIVGARVSDSAATWSEIGGDFLIGLAAGTSRQSCAAGFNARNACFALVLLASRLSPEFVAGHEGLTRFIAQTIDGLRDLLLHSAPDAIQAGRSSYTSPVISCFARRWIEVFPQVFQIDEGFTGTQAARLKAVVVRHRINYYSSTQPGFGTHQAISPHVNRQSAFSESAQFLVADPNRIRRGVSGAHFEGESGVGPGVRRDWFTSVADQLYAGDFGLFERTEAYTRISEYSNLDENFRYYFRAIGRFMALSIIEGVPVGVYFPAMFYKRLIGQEVVLDDIRVDEPVYYRSFNMILGYTADEIEYVCAPIEHSGSTEDVSVENREEQIRAALQNIAINGKVEQFEALREGFMSAIPAEIFAGVTPTEIGSFVFGDSNISVDDLEAHITFSGYSRESPQIRNLFAVLREYSQEDLRKFLRFVTSNTQLPIGGFGSMSPVFHIQRVSRTGASGSVLLPASHTCFNTLDLPVYDNIDELRVSLTRAIRLDSSMGMV